jgi:hypothetical protein
VVRIVLVAVGLLGVVLAACMSDRRASSKPIEIELDVFSGRPNPRWRPDADTEARIRELLRGSHPSAVAPEVGGLGYRGFVLHVDARELRVYADVVSGSGAGPVRVSGLEDVLVTSAQQAGHGALVVRRNER